LVTRVERVAPYFLYGDTNGRYFGDVIGPGTYRVSSTIGAIEPRSVLFTMGTCV
jgi:hypothetical protein